MEAEALGMSELAQDELIHMQKKMTQDSIPTFKGLGEDEGQLRRQREWESGL